LAPASRSEPLEIVMQRRALGTSGRTISEIGLGCMGMSEFYGPRDEAQSLETLALALDHGVDFFDTADMYGAGHNEELIGRFLKGRRDKVVVATKFGIVRAEGAYERRIDNSPAYMRASCEASLKRLGIETIDLYYAHRRDASVPIEETVGAMAELVAAGKARFLGLSEVSPETLRRAHAVHPIAALQTEYSLWSRAPETEMLGLCRELGVTFVAYSPLGRAFLTGTIGKTDDLAPDDFRRASPRFQGEALVANQLLVESLAAFARERNATPAQIALAWLLRKHSHVAPIPGTKRPRYLLENVAAAEIALTPADVKQLDDLFPLTAPVGERYPAAGRAGIEE
jgi:aryl-alcohol dehydrogenase-like predicted oxidoreductase